jgi:hypothetical protein
MLSNKSITQGTGRGTHTYTGGREARVLVEMRRNGRCGHQAVHDDSRMAREKSPTKWKMKMARDRKRRNVERGTEKKRSPKG